MGTAFGAVIDYLFSGTITQTVSSIYGQTLKQQLVAVAPNVTLADNLYSPGEYLGEDFVVLLGRTGPDHANASSNRVYMELGELRIEESFDIPVFIQAKGAGPQPKPTRDIALHMFDAFAHFVHADLSLNGLLNGGRYATLGSFEIDQTESGDDNGSGAGQLVSLTTTLNCRNLYLP